MQCDRPHFTGTIPRAQTLRPEASLEAPELPWVYPPPQLSKHRLTEASGVLVTSRPPV